MNHYLLENFRIYGKGHLRLAQNGTIANHTSSQQVGINILVSYQELAKEPETHYDESNAVFCIK